MSREDLKIPKQENEVTLWVHPEGQVVGTIFLSYRAESMHPIEPVEVLNEPSRFLVLRGVEPNDYRFYSKSAIMRVEYLEGEAAEALVVNRLPCVLHMMDGSLIDGMINRFLPPDNARLYDYLNLENELFIKVHLGNRQVCLVNKSYIVRVGARLGSAE
jgi:hypothetical protein